MGFGDRAAWPGLACVLLIAGSAWAEEPAAEAVELEPMTVSATRRESLELETPVSVTAVGGAAAQRGDLGSVKDLATAVPNANFIEFSARAISNPQFRGVGGSTTNPGVTTYIDGVPQLSADTSSLEPIDLGQAEFVRGAQGTLYGRNTLGGVVTLTSRVPQPDWRLSAQAGVGDRASRLQRFTAGGPLFDPDTAFALALGSREREGFSTNLETERALDSRGAIFGKAQVLHASDRWTLRGIAAAESAHDGDFALYDLAALRAVPYTVRHDYTGLTQRAVRSQTFLATRLGDAVDFRSISGRVDYGAYETTDLDASENDDLVRFNRRRGRQLTQELQWSSATDVRWGAAPELHVGWIGGLFVFAQRNRQNVSNVITQSGLVRFGNVFLPQAPVGVPPLPVTFDTGGLSTPIEDLLGAEDRQTGELRDLGAGLYGQAELNRGEWQLALGLRYDRERKRADLASRTEFQAPSGPQSPDGTAEVHDTREYAAVSPALRVAWLHRGLMAYAGAGQGYRAGGFNPVAPAGQEAYGDEHSLNLEAGLKSSFWDDRWSASIAVFRIALQDLQLNIPIEGGAGRYYIRNAGAARSQGAELELRAALGSHLEPFATLGVLDTRFGAGSSDLGEDVGGRHLPFADPVRATLGARLSLGGLRIEPEITRFGNSYYDASARQALEPVTLVNLRAEQAFGPVRFELWGRNLTDRTYIPLAIPYTGIAPSGYVGENAAPRTVGLTLNYDLR